MTAISVFVLPGSGPLIEVISLMSDIHDPVANLREPKDLDRLAFTYNSSKVHLRLGYVVSLFFQNGETPEKRMAFVETMRNYYDTFADDVTHYVLPDGGRVSAIRDMSFFQAFYDAAESAWVEGEGSAFTPHLLGVLRGRKVTDAPLHYIGGSCLPLDDWFPDGSVSYVDAHIPASWVEANGHSALRDLVKGWCNLLKPLHGTAGLGTLFDQSSRRTTSGLVAFPFLKRFVGLDYNDSGPWRAKASKKPRTIRTTNWLNVIDNGFVKALGGTDAIASNLDSGCSIQTFEGGAVILAGLRAELGDRNRNWVPEHYHSVAKALQSLRFEDYRTPLLKTNPPADPIEETLKWIRRFD
ncbi:type VI immunity family protein [Fulvimarina sp. MAC8]|uniref:type VI immunity family protein n=1 Tax=Fulvimarina sp. MAC8 TaxID=3162874 RepID=UPI0032EBEDEB